MKNKPLQQKNNQPGIFVFSLDTELGSGYFDEDEARKNIFSQDGTRERQSINQVLKILIERNLIGTWAVVGHLFFDKCIDCEVCLMKDWEGKYGSYIEAYKTDHRLWYGADVIWDILKADPPQEIGFHGFTHKIFDERTMGKNEAIDELVEWKKAAKQFSITPKSLVFPRDFPGHFDVLRDHGLLCYRSETQKPFLIRNRYFGKILKTLDQLLGITKVPIYDNKLMEHRGLIALPESAHLFDFNRRVELVLDHVGLARLRIRRIVKAVKRAGREGKIIHLWAHPWEFRTEKDFLKLRIILDAVNQEIRCGHMVSMGMTELATHLSKESNPIA